MPNAGFLGLPPLAALQSSVNLLLLPDTLAETCAFSLVCRKLEVLHPDLNVGPIVIGLSFF